MTEVDKKNNEIILDFYSRYSLKPKSLEFVKSWMASPEVDPIYAKELGPDLRKRWKLDYKFLVEEKLIKDEGFEYFNSLFIYYQVKGVELDFPKIENKDYEENKIVWKKNTIKLKKVLVEFYNSRRDYLFEQWRRSESILGLPLKTKDDITKDASLSEFYVLKANEYIGRFKISNKESTTELVMSSNPADWFMCSTAEDWSSCLNMEGSYGYWAGIPFLLDDKNRTMFYITSNKRTKSHIGIKVDGFNSRSWGILSDAEKIHTVRWFPSSFMNVESMVKLTGLPIRGPEGFAKSKYTILSNITFEDGIAMTPFLDNIGIDKRIAGKITYMGSGSTGVNIINVDGQKVTNHITQAGVSKFLKSNKPYFKYLYTKTCCACNSDIPKRDPFNYDNEYYCDSCVDKLFYICSSCGSKHRTKEEKPTIIEEGNVCPDCFKRNYKVCELCGKIHRKSKSKNGFCPECASSPKVVKCHNADCSTIFLKEKGIHHYSEKFGVIKTCSDGCSEIFKEEILSEKKIKFFMCFECNSWHDVNDAVVLYDGSMMCRKDIFKIADKKQMKFVFK